MFTGLVNGMGSILAVKPGGTGVVLSIEADFEFDEPQEGESIAVNGACLTATNIGGRRFLADVSPETVKRTTLADLRAGSRVNIERALRLSDRLGGHLVSGHVDCVARVSKKENKGEFTIFSFTMVGEMMRYVVEKGSIAIDGISLTVNSCSNNYFSVSIIPHTMEKTTLAFLQAGSRVNIEVDIIGKYVEKMVGGYTGDSAGKDSQERKLDASFLAEHGFF